jgi:chromosome segregation ATPase
MDLLRSDLSHKEQECFSLKSSLDDCPKIEELNRWIGKVKEYEEKQMNACSRMSQMSQELCTCRDKLRRLENEHRELLKVKQELEATLTENKGH